MTNDGQRSDPLRFQIENEMDLLLGRAHPNPAREGCPPRDLLVSLSRRELPIGDPAYEHFRPFDTETVDGILDAYDHDPKSMLAILEDTQAAFGFLGAVARALPFVGVLIALGGIALGALGWIGSTTLVLDLAGSLREYPVRGRNPGLLDFSEAVCERLMSLKR